jgi:hypothetical protein
MSAFPLPFTAVGLRVDSAHAITGACRLAGPTFECLFCRVYAGEGEDLHLLFKTKYGVDTDGKDKVDVEIVRGACSTATFSTNETSKEACRAAATILSRDPASQMGKIVKEPQSDAKAAAAVAPGGFSFNLGLKYLPTIHNFVKNRILTGYSLIALSSTELLVCCRIRNPLTNANQYCMATANVALDEKKPNAGQAVLHVAIINGIEHEDHIAIDKSLENDACNAIGAAIINDLDITSRMANITPRPPVPAAPTAAPPVASAPSKK